MIYLRLLLFFCLSFSCFAEQKGENNLVYNRASQLTVDNINRASEILRDPGKILTEVLNNTSTAEAAVNPAGRQSQFRDPTQLSGTFRQALQAFQTKPDQREASDEERVTPDIELVAKVYIPKTAGEFIRSAIDNQNASDASSIALKIDEDIVHLREGDMSSIIKNDYIFTLQIVEIAQHHVKLTLQPGNESLILH